MIRRIVTTAFANLKWWEKIIGVFLFPSVVVMVFWKRYISEVWKEDDEDSISL